MYLEPCGITLLLESNSHSWPLVYPRQSERALFVHPMPLFPLCLIFILSSTPVAVMSTSTSCPPDPILCRSLPLSAETFQFWVIFQSCSFAIIFASLFSLLLLLLSMPHSNRSAAPAVLNLKSSAIPSHRRDAQIFILLVPRRLFASPLVYPCGNTGRRPPSSPPPAPAIILLIMSSFILFLLRLQTPSTPLQHASCTCALAPTQWLIYSRLPWIRRLLRPSSSAWKQNESLSSWLKPATESLKRATKLQRRQKQQQKLQGREVAANNDYGRDANTRGEPKLDCGAIKICQCCWGTAKKKKEMRRALQLLV